MKKKCDGRKKILRDYIVIMYPYNIFYNLESSLGMNEKKCDGRMHERTDGVTLSLLELLIAAKNQCPADPVEFSKALKHIMALQNSL